MISTLLDLDLDLSQTFQGVNKNLGDIPPTPKHLRNAKVLKEKVFLLYLLIGTESLLLLTRLSGS